MLGIAKQRLAKPDPDFAVVLDPVQGIERYLNRLVELRRQIAEFNQTIDAIAADRDAAEARLELIQTRLIDLQERKVQEQEARIRSERREAREREWLQTEKGQRYIELNNKLRSLRSSGDNDEVMRWRDSEEGAERASLMGELWRHLNTDDD